MAVFVHSPFMVKREMSDEHKQALAKGRSEGKAVRAYLDGLRATKPQRGRKRTLDTVMKRMNAIDEELTEASPIDELALVQERRDLLDEMAAMQNTIDIDALEAEFVKVAKSYSAAKGIAYASWRDVGVPAAVLKQADISRAG